MSSSAVSPLLQVTSPQAEAKPVQAGSSQDGQFHELLARAAKPADSAAKQVAEHKPVQPSDEPATAESGQDQSPNYDEAPANSEGSNDGLTETAPQKREPVEEVPADAVELSETVELVLAAQVVSEETHSEQVASQGSIEASVIDTQTVESLDAQNANKAPAATEWYAKSFEVDSPSDTHQLVPEESSGAASSPAGVEAMIGGDTQLQDRPNLSASELVSETDPSPPTQSAEKALAAQTPSEFNSATTQTASVAVGEQQVRTTSTEELVAKPSQNAAVETNKVPQENPAQKDNPKTREPSRDKTAESPLLKTNALEGAEESVGVVKENSVGTVNPGSQTVAHPSGVESIGTDSRASFDSTAASSSTADANLESDAVPTADRARFVQRVGRAFQKAQARDGLIQLRLSPPELGSMKISITAQEGVLSAKVEVETVAARNLLLDNLPALRERLADQEIRIEKFDVDVSRDGGQETGSSSAEDGPSRESEDGSAPSRRNRAARESDQSSSTQTINPLDQVSDSGLDVRI
jgi:flagellar hook-length control protein FliK